MSESTERPSDHLDGFFDAPAAPEPAAEPDAGGASPPEQPAEVAVSPEPSDPPEDDEAIPEARPGERQVPLSALTKTRNDWKTRAARADEQFKAAELRATEASDRAAALEAQLAEARKAAPAATPAEPPPTQQQIEIPNPAVDPAGYARFVAAELQREAVTRDFNRDRRRYERANPDTDVAALEARMRKLTDESPALFRQMVDSDSPYEFAAQHLARLDALDKIGTDPNAYVAKAIAEARAQWEAETGRAAPSQPAAPPARTSVGPLPQSLAGVRNAAPRDPAPGEDMTSFDALVPKRF